MPDDLDSLRSRLDRALALVVAAKADAAAAHHLMREARAFANWESRRLDLALQRIAQLEAEVDALHRRLRRKIALDTIADAAQDAGVYEF